MAIFVDLHAKLGQNLQGNSNAKNPSRTWNYMPKVKRKMEQKGVNFGTLHKFFKVSQPSEFRRLRNFIGCEFSQPAPVSNFDPP